MRGVLLAAGLLERRVVHARSSRPRSARELPVMSPGERDRIAKVRRAIVKYLEVPKGRVVATARLIEELGANSFTMRQLALALEETFDIDIAEVDLARIRTVEELMSYVAKKSCTSGGSRGGPL